MFLKFKNLDLKCPNGLCVESGSHLQMTCTNTPTEQVNFRKQIKTYKALGFHSIHPK